MARNPLLPWIVLGVAIALVPVYGFSDGQAPRPTTTPIVDDASSFIGIAVHEPTLNASNGYEADALTITHNLPAGTVLDTQVSNTDPDPRFVFTDNEFTLSAGESHTVKIQDTQDGNESTQETIEASIVGHARNDANDLGRDVAYRDVVVTVE